MKFPIFRKKDRAVNDPVRDAQHRYATSEESFHLREERNHYNGVMPFHTTGEFARLTDPCRLFPSFKDGSRGFRSHCSPTAITNLLLLYKALGRAPQLEILTPSELFLRVASLGHRTLLYWNMLLLGRFGGTSLFLTGLYLRLCLRGCRIRHTHLRPHVPGSRERLIHALSEGHPVLLSLLGHRIYGSHTLVAYGLDIVQTDTGKTRYYLIVSDGWASHPRYLPLDSLGVFTFWELTDLS